MKKINPDQLIAIIGKEEADSLFLNPKWIKKQGYYRVSDIKYLIAYHTKDLVEVESGVWKGDVFLCNISSNVLEYLPKVKKINKLIGYFECSGNELTSLQGCPKEVVSGFNCNKNNLVDLVGGPEIVGLFFVCSDNKLTSLKGSPKEVHGNFDCHRNHLTSLEGSPELISGDFGCVGNELTDLEGISNIIGGGFIGNRNHFDKDLVQRTPDGKTYQIGKRKD